MRIQCLKHVPFEGPAAIADWAQSRGHSLALAELHRGDPLPALDSFERLVVMGGPMGVGDESVYGWLAPEKALIRAAIGAGKSVVGVCLGAQLIAEVLGGRVYPNPEKEIGWMPIELTQAGRQSALFGPLPASLRVFHWHGDTFEPPPGAVHLAHSPVCEQQAFLFGGRVLGLQFHLESTPASVAAICAECADELVPAPHIQGAERILAAGPEDYGPIGEALFGILDRLPQ
jgi:GMP synthase-like glutamine amidotransferase